MHHAEGALRGPQARAPQREGYSELTILVKANLLLVLMALPFHGAGDHAEGVPQQLPVQQPPMALGAEGSSALPIGHCLVLPQQLVLLAVAQRLARWPHSPQFHLADSGRGHAANAGGNVRDC